MDGHFHWGGWVLIFWSVQFSPFWRFTLGFQDRPLSQTVKFQSFRPPRLILDQSLLVVRTVCVHPWPSTLDLSRVNIQYFFINSTLLKRRSQKRFIFGVWSICIFGFAFSQTFSNFWIARLVFVAIYGFQLFQMINITFHVRFLATGYDPVKPGPTVGFHRTGRGK